MEYITAVEAAEKWGVTLRQVQRLLAENRIEGANKYYRSWMIPSDAEKPGDPRQEKKMPSKSLVSDLAEIINATVLPMPYENPTAILDNLTEERLRLPIEGELAYLRGDFELTKRCYHKTEGDKASRLRTCSIAIAAAISMGDYPFYLEVEYFLKGIVKTNTDNELSVFAELCLSNAYTGAIAPSMVPEWLKNGDFTLLSPNMKPDAVYKRIKYFQCLGKYESMLAAAETALELCCPAPGITIHCIYFKIMCAAAYSALKRGDEAKRWLREAMKIALPHGFITPFAESATAFGGLLEQLIQQEYPAYYDAVISQWKHTFTNWLAFHNRFTKDNVTLILSLRDYHMAQLAAQGIPNAEIAEIFHISVGRLKIIMHEIYGKLYVNSRKELAHYIL